MQGGLRENHASYSTVVFKQEHMCVSLCVCLSLCVCVSDQSSNKSIAEMKAPSCSKYDPPPLSSPSMAPAPQGLSSVV